MLVYLDKNYDRPDIFRQTPLGSGNWEDLTITTNCPEECDYVVVLNHPTKDIQVKCRKGGRILIIQEPPYKSNDYLTDHFPYFDLIITAYDSSYSSHIKHAQAALPWLIDKTFQELLDLTPTENKQDKASWITTTKNLYQGHEARLAFLEHAKAKKDLIDLFGRGIHPLNDKFEGINPYKYGLAIENYSDFNYWTEKISDIYLSWSMPIYYGCKNIGDFFPERSFIKIDIFKPEEAMEIMEKAIRDKLWDKNKDAIKQARELILNEYQFFPFLSDLISNSMERTQHAKMMNAFIPLNPFRNRLIDKVKRYFK
jgi:hypothetical protein